MVFMYTYNVHSCGKTQWWVTQRCGQNLGPIYNLKKEIHFWRSDKTKEKEPGFHGAVSCGKVICGETHWTWGSLWVRIVCADPPWCPRTVPSAMIVLLEKGLSCFQEIDGGESSFCICCCLNAFSSKSSSCQSGIFWGGTFWSVSVP